MILRILLVILFIIVGTIILGMLWLSRPTIGELVGHAARGNIQGMKRCLRHGVDVNGYSMWGWRKDIKGSTPLTAAVQYGPTEAVQFLVDNGADVNQRSGGGNLPLSWAVIHDRIDVCKILVVAGADHRLSDLDQYGRPQGKTPLDRATKYGESDIAIYLRSLQ